MNVPSRILENATKIAGKGITPTIIRVTARDRTPGQALRAASAQRKGPFRARPRGDTALILVDTSAWIDFLRGRGRIAAEVDRLLETNEVALCGPVITELRRDLKSRAERAQVLRLLAGCRVLEEPARLWEEAGELCYFLGRLGATIKSLDLFIAAYALSHSVPILTRDADFARMKRAGLQLLLADP